MMKNIAFLVFGPVIVNGAGHEKPEMTIVPACGTGSGHSVPSMGSSSGRVSEALRHGAIGAADVSLTFGEAFAGINPNGVNLNPVMPQSLGHPTDMGSANPIAGAIPGSPLPTASVLTNKQETKKTSCGRKVGMTLGGLAILGTIAGGLGMTGIFDGNNTNEVVTDPTTSNGGFSTTFPTTSGGFLSSKAPNTLASIAEEVTTTKFASTFAPIPEEIEEPSTEPSTTASKAPFTTTMEKLNTEKINTPMKDTTTTQKLQHKYLQQKNLQHKNLLNLQPKNLQPK